MKESVVIIGASGHGKAVADIVCCAGDIVKGFLDDNPELESSFAGFPVLGTVEQYLEFSDCQFIVAIGNAAIREKIAERMQQVRWYTAIHPRAVISKLETKIEEGTVIMANAVVNPGTHIGRHCIINSSAVVEHDNQIGDYVHISVGAKLAGTVTIGARSWIGIGAVVRNNVSICAECVVGAGGVVVKDIEVPGTYVGVPVKKQEK